MLLAPLTQLTSHPFAEAFSYLPTPTLLLDNDGTIVASSIGLAELLLSAAAIPALVGRSLADAQSQLGPVATAWAYAHSVVRSTPWVQPPSLLPVASPTGAQAGARWWQPSLTRVDGEGKSGPYWLASAHSITLAAPAAAGIAPALPPEVQQLRDALAHVPGYIITLHGPEHHIRYVGPNVDALLGQNQLVGRLAADVLADLQSSDALQVLHTTYQTGQPTAARELMLPDANNAPRYFNISLQPLRDAGQQITGLLVFGQDVTNRVRQTPALAAPTPPEQEAAEIDPQITSVSSAEGVVEYMSPQWFAYTGQPAEALRNHDWVDALNSDDWAQVLHELPEHLRKGQPWRWEARIRRHDGEYRQHAADMVPDRNSVGHISRWLGTITDIEDTRPTELPVPAPPTPDQQLSDLVPQLLWTLNPDGTPGISNRAALAFTGSEAQPGPASQNDGFPGQTVVQALLDWQHTASPGSQWEHQSHLRQPDGEVRWFLHRAQALRDANGAITRWYGSSTDVHELRQAALRLEEQNEKLSRNHRELDTFVQAAANELRQPIHNLQALFGQMREAVTFHDPDANALLLMADNSLSRWNATVRNLMQLVKAQEQHQLPPEELSLATLTREALLGLHPHLRASGGEVSTHFQSLPTVSYVRPHLLSIITNLLSSSIKQHDPSRPLRLRLESKAGPTGRAQLVVQDNGLGLEPSRSGGRLVRTSAPASDSAPGLYLIHRIVEDHGGRFDVESVPGQGTTFRVTL